ncbi:MAG: ABC transporter permease [Acidimicrobiales bacterium]
MTLIARPGTGSNDPKGGPKGNEKHHTASYDGKQLTIVAPHMTTRQRLVAIWRYRELLIGMTRKELKVQYKDSALGFLWSLLNPAVTLLVYYVVFQIILQNGVPRFAIYLMAGVIVWNFFSSAVPAACGSVVANGGIIKKVAFPREIPALATVGASLVQMGLQSIVLIIFMVAFRKGPAIEFLPLIIPAMIALLLLTGACGVLFAAINVRFRDMTHLLGVAMNVWFWACPIVYTYRLIRDKIIVFHHSLVWLFYLYRLNPITPIVLTFQRAIYGSTSPPGKGGAIIHVLPDHAGPWWYLWQLLVVIAFSLGLFAFAFRVFGRAEGNFAEEL